MQPNHSMLFTSLKRNTTSDSLIAVVYALLLTWLIYSLAAHWAQASTLQRAGLALAAVYSALQSAYAVWRITHKRA